MLQRVRTQVPLRGSSNIQYLMYPTAVAFQGCCRAVQDSNDETIMFAVSLHQRLHLQYILYGGFPRQEE